MLPLAANVQGLAPPQDTPANVCIVPGNTPDQPLLVRVPGYRYHNPAGMEFVVQGYAPFGFMGTPVHRSQTQSYGKLVCYGDKPPSCVLPLVCHANPSDHLALLACEVDAATPKRLLVADAASVSEKSRQVMEGLNFTSWRDQPKTMLIVLDSSTCDESILGHELMHIWLDLVENYEDHRCYRDAAQALKYFAVTSVQSFVIDCQVLSKMKARGFSLKRFREELVDTLYANAVALDVGVRAGNRFQEIVGITMLALPWVIPELYDFTRDDWEKIRFAWRTFEHRLPEGACLAEWIIQVFKLHDFRTNAGMRKLIDALLPIHFQYIGEEFEPARDLVLTKEQVEYTDKHAHWLPNVPPQEKYAVLCKLIREDWPSGTQVTATWTDKRHLAIHFVRPENQKPFVRCDTARNDQTVPAPMPFKYDNALQGAY